MQGSTDARPRHAPELADADRDVALASATASATASASISKKTSSEACATDAVAVSSKATTFVDFGVLTGTCMLTRDLSHYTIIAERTQKPITERKYLSTYSIRSSAKLEAAQKGESTNSSALDPVRHF